MGKTLSIGTAGRALGVGMVGLALAGCGGGGGGGTTALGDIDVTAANQYTLARAAMVGLVGGLATDSLTLSGGSNALTSRVRALSDATAARKRAAAVTVPEVESCLVSGTTSTSFDDRNGDGLLDIGEPFTIVFDACRDDPDAPDMEIDGVLGGTVTQVRSTGLTIEVSASAYTTTWTDHSMRLDGGFTMALDATSATTAQTVISVGNAMVVQAVTPLWLDTITLRAGYRATLIADIGAGFTSTTAAGQVASAAADGYVTTRTIEPLVQYTVDPYPRSGRLEAIGKTGSLQATVLSTSQVQIDLDADGNGAYEASEIVGWDFLI